MEGTECPVPVEGLRAGPEEAAGEGWYNAGSAEAAAAAASHSYSAESHTMEGFSVKAQAYNAEQYGNVLHMRPTYSNQPNPYGADAQGPKTAAEPQQDEATEPEPALEIVEAQEYEEQQPIDGDIPLEDGKEYAVEEPQPALKEESAAEEQQPVASVEYVVEQEEALTSKEYAVESQPVAKEDYAVDEQPVANEDYAVDKQQAVVGEEYAAKQEQQSVTSKEYEVEEQQTVVGENYADEQHQQTVVGENYAEEQHQQTVACEEYAVEEQQTVVGEEYTAELEQQGKEHVEYHEVVENGKELPVNEAEFCKPPFEVVVQEVVEEQAVEVSSLQPHQDVSTVAIYMSDNEINIDQDQPAAPSTDTTFADDEISLGEEDTSDQAIQLDVSSEYQQNTTPDYEIQDISDCRKSPVDADSAKNYRNEILDDWDAPKEPTPDTVLVNGCAHQETRTVAQPLQEESTRSVVNEGPTSSVSQEEPPRTVIHEPPTRSMIRGESIKSVLQETPIKFTSVVVSKDEIIKEILDTSGERNDRPIITGKDLFFSIEFAKRLNQKLSSNTSPKAPVVSKPAEPAKPTATDKAVSDAAAQQEIAAILEADEVSDWKPSPSKLAPKEDGNDLGIRDAVSKITEAEKVADKPSPARKITRKSAVAEMDKELERKIALKQLQDEFSRPRKQSRLTRSKVHNLPFLATNQLEKVLSTATAPQLPGKASRRRPCYVPDDTPPKQGKAVSETRKGKRNREAEFNELKGSDVQEGNEPPTISNPVVRTYTVKRKSTESAAELKTTLDQIAAVTKQLTEGDEVDKPKKMKTVKQVVKKVIKKPTMKTESKINKELENLLGDEGAVRMLYDTQHGETEASPKKKIRTSGGLKKDLILKAKLVKNTMLKLSEATSTSTDLRGSRKSQRGEQQETIEATPPHPSPPPSLFNSTPNVFVYKPKKKLPKAEASRIFHRHSSSESFESNEGLTRASIDEDGVNGNSAQSVDADTSKSPDVLKRRGKRISGSIKVPNKKPAEPEVSPVVTASPAKLQLSNIPLRKSSRPRVASKKYSIWSSNYMDSLSVESLGLKKPKRTSLELGKKLNCKELILQQHGGLVQVVLAPVSTLVKNAFNTEVFSELTTVFEYLSKDDTCQAILLTSTGTTFCQGVDLSCLFDKETEQRRETTEALALSLETLVKTLAHMSKVVIAGVHAPAMGLGVTLLPLCDVVIASDRATFFTPYARLGQAAEGGVSVTLPRVSKPLMTELLYKCEKMSAAEALKLGLVSQVVQDDRFEEETMFVARGIAAQSSQAMESIKSLSRRGLLEELDATLVLERSQLVEHWNSEECLELVLRFLRSGEVQLRQEMAAT